MKAIPEHYFDEYIAPRIVEQGFGMPYPKFVAAAGVHLFDFISRIHAVSRGFDDGHPAFAGIPEERIKTIRTSLQDLLPLERILRKMEKEKALLTFPHATELYEATGVLCFTKEAQVVAENTGERIYRILGIQASALLKTYFPNSTIYGDFVQSINEKTELTEEGLMGEIKLFLGTRIRDLMEIKISFAEER